MFNYGFIAIFNKNNILIIYKILYNFKNYYKITTILNLLKKNFLKFIYFFQISHLLLFFKDF
jgi:hypothetical protein